MAGPSLPISVEMHAMKYRAEGESFEAAMKRIANSLKDDQPHFKAFRDILMDMRFMPGGRVQAAMGADKTVTPYNCLSADTEILTDRGYLALGKHVGEIVQVLSPKAGLFLPAVVKCYGQQQLFNVEISCSSKNDKRHGSFTVQATANHRWVLQSGEVTTELSVGDILKAGDCKIASNDFGFVHGLVFGDGTKQREGKFLIRLCGDKIEHLGRFGAACSNFNVTFPPSNAGDPNVVVWCNTDLKSLPVTTDPSYLRGFVEGLLAADGCFKVRDTDAFAFHGHESVVKWIRDHLVLAGYAPTGRTHACDTRPTNFGERTYAIWKQLFRPSSTHAGFRVVSITPAHVDLVYCVEEPIHKQIVLRNGLSTGQCFVSGTIDDTMTDGTASIMARATEAAQTMRLGGGIGYDFSTLRPRGDLIKKLGSRSSGPISFMHIYDAVCKTIASAGHRRGAQMGVLRVDHPDILEFIHAKQDQSSLSGFNISVAVTDQFMECLKSGKPFPLQFGGSIYREVDPAELWDKIMQNTWDWADPGVLFIDTINRMNNLWYTEKIAATNPSMPAGTLVHTSDGVRPIEEMEGKNFLVKSLDGTWAKAECFLSSPAADVYEIDLGGGRKVRATAEHRWPVLLNGRYTKVYTTDLVAGDLIPLNRNEAMGHTVRTDLTRMDGFAAGYVFGNGSYNVRQDDGRAYLSVSINRLDADIQTTLCEYFSVNATEREHELTVQLTRDADVRTFCTKVGLTLGDKSKLPTTVWASNDDFVAGFIDGLISSDGHVGEGITFVNKAHRVVEEFAILLGFIGVGTTMGEKRTKLNGKEFLSYYARVNVGATKRLANVVELSSSRKNTALISLIREDTRQHISHTHCSVVSVTKMCGAVPVWDISVYHNEHVFPTEYCYTGNCGEQPLPPHGACLLGSFNLTKYLSKSKLFELERLVRDIPHVVRAMDNIVDRAEYPLPQQGREARAKRRMGLGVTGLANAIEAMGHPYGSKKFIEVSNEILATINHHCYLASAELASEKGSFAMFDKRRYLDGEFIKSLDPEVHDAIIKYGMRNSHLTSIAPTGTISICADNVSSGIEPVFSLAYDRTIQTFNGPKTETVTDYGKRVFGVDGKVSNDVTIDEHLKVLICAAKNVDSAVSKTLNVPSDVNYNDFKEIYRTAYEGGAKGCTTFRIAGKKMGILVAKEIEDGASCTIDPVTGRRNCE